MPIMSKDGAPSSGALSFIFSPSVAKRSLAIAGVVGCLLSLTNQGDVLLQEGISPRVGIKILMNFFIPFAVSSVSALMNRNSS
jgi:hypothetical protein